MPNSFSNWLLGIFMSIPAILIAFSVKEYIRSKVAYKLGDKSQKLQGRMTLDPFAHIDILGFILIVLVGIGWCKPAEINRYAFKNPKKDNIKVTLAALFSNILIAFVGALLYIVTLLFILTGNNGAIMQLIAGVFQYILVINVSLFVFNLIPIPGLEMFRLLEDLKPSAAYKILEFTSRYNLIILLAIVLFAGEILKTPSLLIVGVIMKFAMTIVTLFL